ncbi:hypothetical protein NBRC10512_002599 [Rhodotorula toruloides]|uniref:RHTO0S17e01970g1_1 n=2 Tax=Rhodotorula toruloides TaxID=5286 RepID=A0A061BMQ5_RHOTO|nr:uncharacterized protein RHTO_03386 [Rhodotorula toruloides NP11]EMS20467.1 hypothetical protein RHTO_03386 [Rhodotorula toruloides NP11]KAJ8291895.1 hypothetical protein OF846_004683 [Rhodotorula toruloides]CDR48360.1 RHTO0S17e01970g1_1 [Rhodotorula toruloides]
MPHHGIPPEVVDDILDFVKDDIRTLLSCCRASRGLSARAKPLLWRSLEITFLTANNGSNPLLERQSAFLTDALYTNPSLGKLCAALTISWREKAVGDLVRMRTTPSAATIKELFDLVPYVEELSLVDKSTYPRANSVVEKSIIAALASFSGWKTTLRSLSMPRLQDETFSFILDKPKLQSLRVETASSKYPLPTDSAPCFQLSDLAFVLDVDESIFDFGTANSRLTLTTLSAPFSYPFSKIVPAFPNLRHLTIDFTLYARGNRSLQWSQDKRQGLKLFLGDDEQLETLIFHHPVGSPAEGRASLVGARLPRRLSKFILSQWTSRPHLVEWYVQRGLETGDWPPTLKEFVWTSKEEVSEEAKASIEKVCLDGGLSKVSFEA